MVEQIRARRRQVNRALGAVHASALEHAQRLADVGLFNAETLLAEIVRHAVRLERLQGRFQRRQIAFQLA